MTQDSRQNASLASRRLLSLVCLFGLGASLAVSGGLFSKSASAKEGGKASLVLTNKKGDKPKPVQIDVGELGPLKQLIQPWRVRISVGVENKLPHPQKVKVELRDCDLPWVWQPNDWTWNPATNSTDAPLPPGKRFSITLFTSITPELRQKPVVCTGKAVALHPETGEELGFVPFKITNSAVGGEAAQSTSTEGGSADHAIHK